MDSFVADVMVKYSTVAIKESLVYWPSAGVYW
jgi:hypothetical protein